MEQKYAKIGNTVRIIRLYGTDERECAKIGDMFTITRVSEQRASDVYGHKSGTHMALSQLELVKQETPLAQILRERYDLFDGDKFRFKNKNTVWKIIDYCFYIVDEDSLIKYGNMFDKVIVEILKGEREIEKITEPILVEVVINGKKFKVTKEVAKEVIVFMTSREGE